MKKIPIKECNTNMNEILKICTDGKILVNGVETKDAKEIGSAFIKFAKVYVEDLKKQKKGDNKMKDLIGETDATIWAGEFVKIVNEKPQIATDKETMTCWFANAIETGYNKAKKEQSNKERV